MKVPELLTELRGLTVDDLQTARERSGRSGLPPAAAAVDGPGRGRQQDAAAAPRAGARQDRAPREGRQGLSDGEERKLSARSSATRWHKSVVVTVERQVRDELYGKQQRLHVALHGARREERGARSATASRSSQSRPLSRRKRWVVTRVVEQRRRVRLLTGDLSHDSDAIDPRRRRQLRRAQDRRHQPDRRIDRPLRAHRRHRHGVGQGSHAGRDGQEGPGRQGRDRADAARNCAARTAATSGSTGTPPCSSTTRASRSARACSARWRASCASAGS